MKHFLSAIALLAFSSLSHAQLERFIAETRFFQDGMLVNGSVYGTLHLTGYLDRPEQPDFGFLQFRRHAFEAWQTVTPTSHPVTSIEKGIDWRRISVSPVPTSGFEFRICYQGEPCSAPYEFLPQLKFRNYIQPTTGTQSNKEGIVTPFSPRLRFGIENNRTGNVRFQIGKLSNPGSSIQYRGYVNADIPRGCPEPVGSDPFACEIIVPTEVLKAPGQYVLTGVSDYGTSVNYMKFEVMSVFKIVSIVPEKIRIPIQTVLTLHFAGGIFRPTDIDVTLLNSNCNNRRMLVRGPGNDQVDVIIPPPCMPQSGVGNMDFSVNTPEGQQIISVPYEIR